FVLVQQGGGCASFARTLHLEGTDLTTCVVDVPFADPRAVGWVLAEMAAASGYSEARYDAAGRRWEPVLKPLPPPHSAVAPALGADDVMLITGGGKGIAAECTLAIGREAGVRVAVLGRSQPAADEELAANLARVAAAGIR